MKYFYQIDKHTDLRIDGKISLHMFYLLTTSLYKDNTGKIFVKIKSKDMIYFVLKKPDNKIKYKPASEHS